MPHGFDAVTEVIEDVAALNAAACGQESTDNTGNVAADVKLLRVINAYALHTETESTDTRKNDRLTFRQPVFQDFLQFRYYTDDGTLGETAVTTGFCCNVVEGYLALTDRFCKILSIRAAALDIVSYQLNPTFTQLNDFGC